MPTPAELLSIYTSQGQMGSFMVDKMGLVSVKAFGAKGDGLANDTAAILATATYATEQGLKSIFFPHGTYKLDAGTGTSLSGFFLWGDNTTVTGDTLTINQIGTNNTEYITAFTGLTDAPKSLTGQSGKVLKVKSTEDALELAEFSAENTSATEVVTGGGATVQSNMEAIYGEVRNYALGNIPNDSVTDAKLSKSGTDIYSRFATHLADNAAEIADLQLNKADKTEINSLATEKADITYVDTKTAAAVSGAPIAASLASEMTDHTRNYVYTGSEVGYTAGHWYYWNGSIWSDGGVYQSTGIAPKSVSPESTTFIEKIYPPNFFNGLYDEGFIGEGTYYPNSVYRVTKILELPAGDYVWKVFQYTSYGAGVQKVFLYDESGNYSSSITPTLLETDSTAKTEIYTATLSTASKVRLNIGTTNDHVAKFVIAFGTTASDYPSVPTSYFTPYFQIGDDINISNAEEITIANSSKIGFFSNSFLNGYTMKGKHPLNDLGMWSDYVMYNYGHSGDDLLECLGRINRNEKWLGDVPVNQWGLTYAVIAMQDNDGALYAANPDTYYENAKKLAYALMSQGALPILGTEHDSNKFYYAFSRLANDLSCIFMDWGRKAFGLYKTIYPGFWYNSHPATRTHWLWTYGMKQYLDTLPRPRKAIKIFRLRGGITYSSVNELVFNTNIERSKIFKEIYAGANVLTDATAKYFDRMNNTSKAFVDLKDEYQTLQAKTGTLAMGDEMLVDIVTPYNIKGIKSMTVKYSATGVIDVYIKKNAELSNPLPDTRYIAFGVTAGAELLTPGTSFNITGGVFSGTLVGTYTVEDVVNNMVVTTTSSSGKTTSGTDTPVCSIVGVTLSGSYDYPSADYMTRYNKPLAEYVKLNPVNGEIFINVFKDYMDYDKISLLFTGASIVLSDISAFVSGQGEKINLSKSMTSKKSGSSMLSNTTFASTTGWNGTENTTVVTPITDGANTEAYPFGITAARELPSGQSISQSIITTNISTDWLVQPRMQVRIVARYFPKYVLTDVDWDSTELNVETYDCATLDVGFKVGTAFNKIASLEVGAYWNEFIIETDYFESGDLTLSCSNKKVQLAKVECVLI